jgi:hypothetical protein
MRDAAGATRIPSLKQERQVTAHRHQGMGRKAAADETCEWGCCGHFATEGDTETAGCGGRGSVRVGSSSLFRSESSRLLEVESSAKRADRTVTRASGPASLEGGMKCSEPLLVSPMSALPGI